MNNDIRLSSQEESLFRTPKGRKSFIFSVFLLIAGFLLLWLDFVNLAPFVIIGAYILLGVSLFI